ncbi:MAG TPA: ParB N-terminal domain-containing protein [Bryobacteraceae bacterium]|nr:ParB N-terminal domain-containing protein [Bryobacteraceae bacterium]
MSKLQKRTVTVDQSKFETVEIPLSKLLEWDGNVRKTNPDAGLKELAAKIRSVGFFSSLVVKPASRGKVTVVAGGRRLRALSLLADEGAIPNSFLVTCRLLKVEVSESELIEIGLMENHHEPMHPADEFEAFSALVEDGKSAADIAARFGVTQEVVMRRLALARVHPSLIKQYRKGALTLELLQAFTLTDNHDLQQHVWKQLQAQPYTNPHTVRQMLARTFVEASDKRVRFVGLTNYENEGGPVRRDLFAEVERGVYIEDVALLERLVSEKLSLLAETLTRDGWKWVAVVPDPHDPSIARLRRLPPEPSPLSAKRQARLEELEREQSELEAQLLGLEGSASEDESDPRYARLEEIEEEIEKIQGSRREYYSPKMKAQAGAVVGILHDGSPHYIYGLLRKEDEAALRKETTPKAAQDDTTEPEAVQSDAPESTGGIIALDDDSNKPAYSAALVEALTTYKTAAIAAELTQNPHVALAAVVHAHVLRVFGLDLHVYRAGSCLQLSGSTPNLLQAKGSKAALFLEDQHALWISQLPHDEKAVWQWCIEQDDATLLRLLAFLAATSLDAIQQPRPQDGGGSRVTHGNAVAAALRMDMTQWFTATAENFFDRVSKTRICQALREAGKDGGPSRESLKKGELSKLAEQDIAGSGWLPGPLRIAEESAGPVEEGSAPEAAA